jgi:hypothetical protein
MLQPYVENGVPVERQQQLLDYIRANPLASYVFGGPPGAGKTTFMKEVELVARVACPKNFAIYFKTAAQYQRETTAVAKGDYVPGLIRPEVLADSNHGIKWGAYLDDVDKISGSEFIRLQLFDLISAVCEERTPETQLVMSTNMNKEEFKKFFGDAMAWRVFKKCRWVAVERQQPVAAT